MLLLMAICVLVGIPGVDGGNRTVDRETSSAEKKMKCANKAHNVTTITTL